MSADKPENPAAILHGIHDLRYEQHDLPAEVPAGHCRIQIKSTGICGSDLHFYESVCCSFLKINTAEDTNLFQSLMVSKPFSCGS